jgi:UbiD family decarboxylase
LPHGCPKSEEQGIARSDNGTPGHYKTAGDTCWPKDGGPFVTLPVIHTKDPNTGQRNVGMYRMQIFGPALTAMHWHKHKVSAKHFNEYKKLGIRMPVAVALGVIRCMVIVPLLHFLRM